MSEQYLAVALFMIVGLLVGIVPIALGSFLGPRRPDSQKNSPFECGFEAFGDARMQFDVRYYLMAILFILFDIETVFFFPWALVLNGPNAWQAYLLMMVFVLELAVVFAWLWRKGALEWE
jgi:NADH-quinone oxidoreductase subunit A